MAFQELKRLEIGNSTSQYETAVWFDPQKCFAELQIYIKELNVDGWKVLSVVPLQTESFSRAGVQRQVTTQFALLCEK